MALQSNSRSGRRLVAASAAALIFSGATAAGTAGARSMQCAPATQATIDGQFQRFSASWATGNPGKVAALFARDAVLLATVSNKPRTSPAEIRDYFEHFLVSRPVARIDSSTTRIGCNMATRVGTWSITLTDPKTHKKSEVQARYSFVYMFDRGQWWIDHLHSSKMPEPIASGH